MIDVLLCFANFPPFPLPPFPLPPFPLPPFPLPPSALPPPLHPPPLNGFDCQASSFKAEVCQLRFRAVMASKGESESDELNPIKTSQANCIIGKKRFLLLVRVAEKVSIRV
jgi:hypothetical protein